ncbi:transcription factor BIM2 [Euphorbia lathyris]|uniref:transcription factor BIM2 n=1 Tax=Euphorbia lathyris TaxID=212925 RepID=UPI0033144058
MRGKGNQNQDEEEYDEEDFGSRKDGPSLNVTSNNNNNSSNINKDGKNSDKASAIRSKHSVTEQRRRSKINERFQILRDLIPHSDQKRDTASFLLEVIEYVQYLQEKVQKFEGSYQGWNSEPTKLMPWRNSHWRIQNFSGHPQAVKNGSGLGSIVPGKFDENNIVSQAILTGTQNHVTSDPSKAIEEQSLPMPLQPAVPTPVRCDAVGANPLQQTVSYAHSVEFPTTSDTMVQPEELTIEGGTINISSIYSQGLLNNLTQSLQSAGVDLSNANISVQIDLGKKGNKGVASISSTAKDSASIPCSNHLMDVNMGEDSDQAQKRQKT